MSNQILSPALLRELFNYDPNTGILKWKVTTASTSIAGQNAGAVNDSGYVIVGVFLSRYRAHRLIWAMVYGEYPKFQIDHINGLRSDNRINNLRDVPGFINVQNRHVAHEISSGKLLGATFDKRSGMWKSQVGFNGKNIHLGRYETAEEAHHVYIKAKKELHRDCAT